MIHEKQITIEGPTGWINCLACGRRMAPAHLVERDRTPYYFGISLGTEKKVVVVCDICHAEHSTRAKTIPAFLQYRPDYWNAQIIGSNRPLFPRILLFLVLLFWWCPIVGAVSYWYLKSYEQYVRGKWRTAYRLLLWPTIVANGLWLALAVFK